MDGKIPVLKFRPDSCSTKIFFFFGDSPIALTPSLSGVCQDAKINSLERGLRDMEEEVIMLKSNGLLSCEERQEEMKQMEVYRSHTKFMKNKV